MQPKPKKEWTSLSACSDDTRQVDRMLQRNLIIDRNIRIVVVSDWHLGVKGCREDIIRDVCNELKNPNTYWIGIGDYIDGREPSHKFYDAEQAIMTVGEQYERFFEYVRPYTRKCLGMVLGNHEAGLIRRSTINPIRTFCADNQIPYADNTMWFKLNNGFESISMVINHGAGGGTKVGSNLNKAVEYGKTFNADVVVLGHFHRLAYTEECKGAIDDEGRFRFKPMSVVLNGCTLEGYNDSSVGSYVEQKMLAPCALGYAVIGLDTNLNRKVELCSY